MKVKLSKGEGKGERKELEILLSFLTRERLSVLKPSHIFLQLWPLHTLPKIIISSKLTTSHFPAGPVTVIRSPLIILMLIFYNTCTSYERGKESTEPGVADIQ